MNRSPLPFMFSVLAELCIGQIPPDIVKLTKLEVVNLAFNQLTGQCWSDFAPILQLKRYRRPFKEFFLSWLCIGPIPPKIVELTKLRDLRLFSNKLTGLYLYNLNQRPTFEGISVSGSKSDRGEPSSTSRLSFCCLVLNLHRTHSARNGQNRAGTGTVDFPGNSRWKPLHRSLFSQFDPMILKAFLFFFYVT